MRRSVRDLRAGEKLLLRKTVDEEISNQRLIQLRVGEKKRRETRSNSF